LCVKDPSDNALGAGGIALVGGPDHVEEAGEQVGQEQDRHQREGQPEVLVRIELTSSPISTFDSA
jgi:hypothetical protein